MVAIPQKNPQNQPPTSETFENSLTKPVYLYLVSSAVDTAWLVATQPTEEYLTLSWDAQPLENMNELRNVIIITNL